MRGCQDGDVISVTRTWPPPHDGWLDDIQMPPGGAEDIPVLLRERWGGGKYHVKVKRRRQGVPGLPFSKVHASFQIAGEPKSMRAEVVASPSAMMMPMPYQHQVAAPPPGADLQQSMMRLLESAVKTGGTQSTDLAALADVILRASSAGQRQSDSFGELERMLGMVVKLRTVFAPAERSDAEPIASSPFGAGGDGLAQMLMAKFLGDNNVSTNMQPPPVSRLGQPPSPDHVFHPRHGWIHPAQLVPTPARQPAAAAPTPGPAATTPTTRRPVEAVPNPTVDDTDDEAADEQPPMTADELAVELAVMSKAELDKILPVLLAKMSIPAGLVERLQHAEQPGESSPVDVDTTYPLVAES